MVLDSKVTNISLDDLPDENDIQAVAEFAGSFNGYEHFGSFEACASEAKSRKRATLVDLRNELFFSLRGSRHRGDDEFLETYGTLLPLLRAALSSDR